MTDTEDDSSGAQRDSSCGEMTDRERTSGAPDLRGDVWTDAAASLMRHARCYGDSWFMLTAIWDQHGTCLHVAWQTPDHLPLGDGGPDEHLDLALVESLASRFGGNGDQALHNIWALLPAGQDMSGGASTSTK